MHETSAETFCLCHEPEHFPSAPHVSVADQDGHSCKGAGERFQDVGLSPPEVPLLGWNVTLWARVSPSLLSARRTDARALQPCLAAPA